MLAKQGIVNDLSTELREYLQKEWDTAPKKIIYKFNISSENKDPERYNGPVVWPNLWKLPRVRYQMVDPFVKPSRQLTIGLPDTVDEKGNVTKWKKVSVTGAMRGQLELRRDRFEDQETFAYLELHPLNGANKWRDKDVIPVFHRVDEEKVSIANRDRRKTKVDAMAVAADLQDDEVKNFAAALNWDENEPIQVLRDRLEELAEKEYVFFTELFNTGNLEYRYTVKRAVDNHIIVYVPVESKFIWVTTQQTIAVLPFEEAAGKDEIQRMGEWMATVGAKGDEVYKKLKQLLKAAK